MSPTAAPTPAEATPAPTVTVSSGMVRGGRELADPTFDIIQDEFAGNLDPFGGHLPTVDQDSLELIWGNHPFVAGCLRANAGASTDPEIRIRKTVGKGEYEVLDEHPALDVLYKPNPMMDGFFLRAFIGMQLETHGQAFLVADDRAGEIWPMHATRVGIDTKGGTPSRPISKYTFRAAGRVLDLKPERVIHMKYPNPWSDDPYHGYSKVRDLWPTLQQSDNARAWLTSFFENGALVGGQFSVPGELSKDAYKRMLSMINQRFKGVKRWFKPYLAEGGAKYERMAATVKEAMPVELEESTIKQIMAVMQTPPIVLGLEASTFATAREQRRNWFKGPIRFMLGIQTGAFNTSLFRALGIPDDNLEFFADLESVEELQKDRQQQASIDQIYINLGVYGPEYVRARDGYPEPEEPEQPEPTPPADPNADPAAEDAPADESNPPEDAAETEPEDDATEDQLSDGAVPVGVRWPVNGSLSDPPAEFLEFLAGNGLLSHDLSIRSGHWWADQGVPATLVLDTFHAGNVVMGRLRAGASEERWWGGGR